jgi:hypothetical protein
MRPPNDRGSNSPSKDRRLTIDIIVTDSSRLIDLRTGGLLTIALRLPHRFAVALPLITSKLHGFNDSDWRGRKPVDWRSSISFRSKWGEALDLKALYPAPFGL